MSKKLNITYLLETTRLWGGTKIVFEQVNRLLEMGHNVKVVSKDGQPDWFNLKTEVLQVADFKGRNIPKSDLVIGTYFTTVRDAHDCGIGIPVHFCQGYEGDQPELKNYIGLIDFVYSLNTVKLTITKTLKDMIENKFKQKCYLISNGIDSKLFYNKQKISKNDDIINILLVGSYNIIWKGIREGLEALKIVKFLKPNIRIIRVSQTPLTNEEKEIGIIDEYYYNIKPEKMADLYNYSDIFISTSYPNEGFGLPALEAMACGIPCILTNIPSYKSFDIQNDYALFVPPYNYIEIANAVFKLIENHDLRNKLAERGREVARKFYWENIFPQIEETFLRIYEENKRDFMIYSERIVPGKTDEFTTEMHYSNYNFALKYIRNKNVLDAGCGVGYGAQLMAENGANVIAIDKSKDAIEYALKKYSHKNLNYTIGDITKLEFNDNSFEVITCFEVIEYIEDYQKLLKELRRVLCKDGICIISTPNKKLYSPNSEPQYIHHVKEWYLGEFIDILNEYFSEVTVYGKRNFNGKFVIDKVNENTDISFVAVAKK